MPEPTLNKALSKGTDIVALTFNKIADSPVALKALYRAFTQNGSRGVFSTLKEMDAELTDEEAATVSTQVISQIFGTGSQGDAYGSWKKDDDEVAGVRPSRSTVGPQLPGVGKTEDDDDDDEAVKALQNVVYGMVDKHFPGSGSQFAEFRKEFDDVLAQISAPKGGTENFTNVSTPGAPPGKISAEPGKSGRQSNRMGYTIGSPRQRVQGDGSSDFYNSSTVPYSDAVYQRSGIAGQPSPNQRINSNTRGQDWDQVGPVGERGATSHIPSTSALKPSNVSPGQGSTDSQYKHWSLTRNLMAPTQIDRLPAFDKQQATRIVKTLKARYSGKRDDDDISYGTDQTPPPTDIPGDSRGGTPVGWSGSSDDQATQWSNEPSASPNQVFSPVGADDLDIFGEEETEEQRAANREFDEITRRSEELEEYARVADRQARESDDEEERRELKEKAVQLRNSAFELRKKVQRRTLTK